MTYQQFKEMNDKVKRTKSFIPITLFEIFPSKQSVQMDKIRTSTNPMGITIEGFVNAVKSGIVCASNPSKLSHWRGFTK